MEIFLLNDRVVGPLTSIASDLNEIKTTDELRKKYLYLKTVPLFLMIRLKISPL